MEALAASRVTRRRFGRDVQANVGGVLFLIAALVTMVGMLAPHSEAVDTEGMVLLSFGCLAFGGILFALPHRLAKHSPPLIVTAGVLAITAGLFLSGERHGGVPMLNELFFFWPAFFVGYFFTVRGAALTWLGIAGCYAAVLSQLPVPFQDVTARYIITVSSLAGTIAAMRMLRRHVDRLVTKLNALARTDVLTGLLNRRAFDEQLANELDRARRTKERFGLVLADIDNFKSINDRHGHAKGDEALKTVASLLTEHSRSIDTVARIGGEEFALLLPNADLEDATETAERLREALKQATRHDPITMSLGVVEGPLHGRLPDDLLRTADRALYQAKAKGRDRTVTPSGATAAIATR
jgi:diguanylate cyclase (GGDEF)-like protein